MQRTSANYWVFWLFSDFISYQQDSRQCLDRDSPTGQVRLMPTGTSRSTTMNLWQLGSYLEHFSSFLSLLLLTIAYSKNSIADSLDPYEWPVPWLLGHGPAEQWKTVASISCCQPWEPRSGTQDGKASLKVTSKSTNKAIANDWKNAWYAFVTSRIVEFFLQVWSYLSIWGPPKLPPSPSKNRKNKSTINNVGWPRHALTNGVRRFWFLKILFWGLRIQCVEKIWNNHGYVSSFSMCCSAGMDFPPPVYRTRHYHLSCDTHSYRLPLVRMSCHTSHLANAGVQNVNKCDKWRMGARRILWRCVDL